jgi:hypothetical protein
VRKSLPAFKENETFLKRFEIAFRESAPKENRSLLNSLERLELKTMNDAKLIDACRTLGISLLEISRFVQVSDDVEVACWGYEVATGQNYIYINPKTLRLSTEFIALILRHEVLHYAGYADMHHVKNHDFENLLMDMVINPE